MRFLAVLLIAGGVAAMAPASAQAPAGAAAQVPADAASAPAEPTPPGGQASPATPSGAAAAAPAASVTASVGGLWCGSGPLHAYSLKLTQRQQDVQGELARPGKSRTIEGRVVGNVLRTQSTKVGALVLEHKGDELKITGGDGIIALARGQVFRRSDSGTCSG